MHGVFSFIFRRFDRLRSGGDDGIRTHDPLLAGQVLSQLSYTPIGLSDLFSLSMSLSLTEN